MRRAMAILFTLIVLGSLTSCVASGEPESSSTEVHAGSAVSLLAPNGGPRVTIAASAFSGAGKLTVTPIKGKNGPSGWTIKLSGGATLTGKATIGFREGSPIKGEPLPLVAFADPQTGSLTLADSVKFDKKGEAVVTTTHFSNWFVGWWDDVAKSARKMLDKIYSSTAQGKQPACAGSAKPVGTTVTVDADKDARVLWCVGTDATGRAILKVTNARGYSVAVEESPGVVLTNDSTDLLHVVPQLLSVLSDVPSKKGNTVHLLQPGDTFIYNIVGPGKVGIRATPSPGGYIGSALEFGADTVLQLAPFLPIPKTGVGKAAIMAAMPAVGCVKGMATASTAKVENAAEAESVFNDTVGTVFGCLGGVISKTYGDLGFWGTVVVTGISWVVDGLKLAANGIGAAADTLFNAHGFTVEATTVLGTGFTPLAIEPFHSVDWVIPGLEFDAPSHNIHCGIYDFPDGGYYGCAIDHYTFVDLPDTTGCSQEISYGGDFQGTLTGDTITEPCYGGEEFGGQNGGDQVLPYGDSLTYKDITCTSENDGISCGNTKNGSGFKLWRSGFTIFPSN